MVVGITIQGRWLGVFVVRNGHGISASARTPQDPDFPSVRPLAPVACSRNFPCTSAVLIVRPIIVGSARPVRAVGDPTDAAPPCSRGSSSSSSPRACSSHSSPRQSSPRRTTHPRHQGRASGAICSRRPRPLRSPVLSSATRADTARRLRQFDFESATASRRRPA